MRVFHRKLALMLMTVFLIGYGLFQARDYLRGPQLTLDNPSNGAVVKNVVVSIRGKAEDISRLTLNGRAIFTDAHGNFSEQLLLAPGLNIIKLEAQDKFGKLVSIERMVSLE